MADFIDDPTKKTTAKVEICLCYSDSEIVRNMGDYFLSDFHCNVIVVCIYTVKPNNLSFVSRSWRASVAPIALFDRHRWPARPVSGVLWSESCTATASREEERSQAAAATASERVSASVLFGDWMCTLMTELASIHNRGLARDCHAAV